MVTGSCYKASNLIRDNILVSYLDPDSHSCGWITSRCGDVIHPQLWESGSGYGTNITSGPIRERLRSRPLLSGLKSLKIMMGSCKTVTELCGSNPTLHTAYTELLQLQAKCIYTHITSLPILLMLIELGTLHTNVYTELCGPGYQVTYLSTSNC